MKKENWKPIVGYEGLYEISDLGHVKRIARTIIDSMGRQVCYEEKMMSICISKQTGYPYVSLTKDGKQKPLNIHTLIADAFIPNPHNLPCINHIDENRKNSVLSNIERCTYSYNNTYGNIKEKRRNTYLARHSMMPILQYDKTGKLIKRYDGGLKDVYEANKKIFKLIRQCLIGWKKSAYGYVWMYEGTPFSYVGKPYYSKPVCQYDIYGTLIKKYEGGLEEIKRNTDFNIDNIRGCLKGKCKTSLGYVWLFEDVVFSYVAPQPKKQNKKSKSNIKKNYKYVILLGESGEEKKRYASLSEAGRALGFDRHYFSRATTTNGIISIKGLQFIVENKNDTQNNE